MATEHVDITDPEIHEPKGASTASVGNWYVADGVGSGSWTNPTEDFSNHSYASFQGRITDVSTAGSYWVVSPFDGDIVAIYTVLHTAISVADSVLSFEIAGTAVTGGGITVAFSGSAAGDVDSAFPTALNSINEGQALEIITDGGSTTASVVEVTIVIDTSA